MDSPTYVGQGTYVLARILSPLLLTSIAVAFFGCGETYFRAGLLLEEDAAGDGDTGDGDGDDGLGGAGGRDGSNDPLPGSLGLDPISATPFEYLDCDAPNLPSGPPPEGGTVVSADTVITYASNEGFFTTFSEVSASGEGFDSATRVQVDGTPRHIWHSQVIRNSASAIDTGDALLAEVWVRCEVPLPGKDVCQAMLILEDSGTYDKAIQFPILTGSEWTHVFVAVEAPQDYGVGVANTTLFTGYADQTIDVGPVTLHNYGGSVEATSLPSTPLSYPGIASDAAWRETASARIDTVRRDELEVTVLDSSGAPVEGADVHVRMLKHEFFFGSAVSSEVTIRNEEPEHTERYVAEAKRLFNITSAFNAMKWKPWAGDWGTGWSKERGAEMLDWAESVGLPFRGHVLVWPGWSHLPESLESQSGDPDALRQAVLDHIDEAMELTAGRTVHWDVVNQPFEHRDLMDILGDDVVVEWFERARAGDPDTKLFINDYGILSAGPGNTGHHEDMEHWVEVLDGAPLDGLAFTSDFRYVLTGPEDVYATLNRFGTDLGKEIVISQYGIHVDDEVLSACFTHDFMTAIFSHPSVSTFQMWGFWGDGDVVFEYDWTKKAAGQVYEDLVLQRWWTDETDQTNASGVASVRAFFGDYEVSASVGDRTTRTTVLHSKNAPAKVTLELPD